MTEDLQNRVESFFLPERTFISRKGEMVRAKDIVFLTIEGKNAVAIAENSKRYNIVQSLADIEREFKGYFLQVHRSFLVALDRVEGVFERYPETEEETPPSIKKGGAADECELTLRGTEKRIPVTVTYAGPLKKALGTFSLHHLVPEYPDDKRLRLLEITDLGWRELFSLDSKDTKEVEEFKKKWDIKEFTRERMLSYFRQFGVNEISKRRVIKNIIYQLFRWIKKGIEPLCDGNIRSLWYKIKTVLAYHSDILEPGDVDIFYNTLQEMVEVDGLFRYKDFGFMDMNAPYQGIGAVSPQIILASEKIGHFFFISDLAKETGVSFICLKGEPAVISLEYFSDGLMKACGDKPKTIFCVSDFDPSGYSIQDSLVSGLQRNGHQVTKVVKLLDASSFTSEQIAFVRYPVVKFETKGDQVKPVKPAMMSQVTKSRAWFNVIKDDRFFSEKDKGDGWKIATVWGIESDAGDKDLIRKRFLAGLSSGLFRSRRKAGA